MIWLQPWAWLGLAGIALPVLIHLLARGHARLHRFPTLRFLDASRLLPTRRTRVHDVALLVVRCSAIAFAVAALAHPLLLTTSRKQTLDRGLARAIIVDTSASMHRSTPTGGAALDSARRMATTAAAGAQTSVIVESNDPPRAIASANRWLARQGRRGELVVISDFQRGQIDSSDLVVPNGIGLTLSRIATRPPSVLEQAGVTGGNAVVARATLLDDRTDAQWISGASSAFRSSVLLLAAAADQNRLTATRDAAATVATTEPVDSTRAVAIVFPTYAQRQSLETRIKPVDAMWMAALLGQLRADAIPASRYGVAEIDGRRRLVVFVDAAPGTAAATLAVADANRAMSIAPPAGELEPVAMTDAALASLERSPSGDVPTQMHPTDENGPSDARWFWLAALAMLLVELPLRRARGAVAHATPKEHARAA